MSQDNQNPIHIKKLPFGMYELKVADNPIKIVNEKTIKQVRKIFTHGQIIED